MSTGNISIDLLLSDLKSYQDIQDRTQITVDDFIPKIKKAFPSISDIDALKLINLLLDIQCQSEKVELTITSPVSSKVHIKQNQVVIQEMLSSAQKSIIMTGYSMSDYFSDYVDLLIAKCQRGILVQVFFNHAEKQEQIEKLLRYQGKYLRLYDYHNANDTVPSSESSGKRGFPTSRSTVCVIPTLHIRLPSAWMKRLWQRSSDTQNRASRSTVMRM